MKTVIQVLMRWIKFIFQLVLLRPVLRIKSSWWLKTILVPLIVALPPVLLGASDKFDSIKEVYSKHPWLTPMSHFWPLILIPATAIYHKLSQYEPVSQKQLLEFLTILDHIVGKKAERFGIQYRRIYSLKSFSAKEAFISITQPEDQIRELVEGIWKYFELTKTDSNVNIRVALAAMGNEHIESFECFYPADPGPRSELGSLQVPESGFSTARKSKKIVIVSDIFNEGRKSKGKKFVITREDLEDEEGSMICYPIEDRHGKSVPFVVSICSSKKGYFKNSEKEKYSLVLRRFAKRIILEYYLKLIKDRAV